MYEYTLLAAQHGEIHRIEEFTRNPKNLKKCDLYIPSPNSSIHLLVLLARIIKLACLGPRVSLVVGVDVDGLRLCYAGVTIREMSAIMKERVVTVVGEEDRI